MAGGVSGVLTIPLNTDLITLALLAACCKDVAQTEAPSAKPGRYTCRESEQAPLFLPATPLNNSV